MITESAARGVRARRTVPWTIVVMRKTERPEPPHSGLRPFRW